MEGAEKSETNFFDKKMAISQVYQIKQAKFPFLDINGQFRDISGTFQEVSDFLV